MSVFKDLQAKFKTASIVEQLIYINVIVFLITILISSFSGLYGNNSNFIYEWFAMPSSFDDFITQPWTIITYGFLHSGFLHILFNSIWLYFFGRLFLEYFTPKTLLTFYLLGTFFGGIAYFLSYNYFPVFQGGSGILLGASAGVSAIVVGTATHIPNYQIKFRFIGFVKVWHIAAFSIALDVMSLAGSNGGGHFSHLGGALFGYLYVSRTSNKNVDIFGWFTNLFQKKEKPLKTVHRSGKKKAAPKKHAKSNNQQQIDHILDKISKSGYDTLTKEEKEFLFKQGK